MHRPRDDARCFAFFFRASYTVRAVVHRDGSKTVWPHAQAHVAHPGDESSPPARCAAVVLGVRGAAVLADRSLGTGFPRSPARPRAARALATAALLALAAGCLSDRPATASAPLAPARLAITAQVSSANGAQLHVRILYVKLPASAGAAADTGLLLDERFPLGVGERAIAVDVTRCLADRARPDPGPFCEVIAEIELLDAGAMVLDRKVVPPLRVRPGETVEVSAPVQLFEVASVVISTGAPATIAVDETLQLTASARDVAQRDIPGRRPQWESSDAAVATVGADDGLVTGRAPGTARITARAGGKSSDIDVTVTPRPAIGLAPRVVAFVAPRGTLPGAAAVAVENAGGGSLTGLAVTAVRYGAGEPADWLAEPTLDGTTAPTTLRLRPATADLPTGNYTAWVVLAASTASSPDSVQVTYAMSEGPVIRLSLTSVTLRVQQGSDFARDTTLSVTNANPAGGTLGGLSASVALLTPPGAPSWLEATVGAQAPTTLTISPTTTDLEPGSYTATVTVSSTLPGVAPREVSVTYVVEEPPPAPPELALSAERVSYTALGGEPLPAARTVQVRNVGGGTIAGLEARVGQSGRTPVDWLTASLDRTTATAGSAATLTLTVASTNFRPMDDTLTVTITTSTPGIGPVTVRAALDLKVSFTEVTAGGRHSCALTRTGKAYCWGDNQSSQLGDGTESDRAVPTPVAGGHRFTEISAGLAGTCGIAVGDTLFCWGTRPTASTTPRALVRGGSYSSITVGDLHACVITPPGALSNIECWGDNGDGQLGDGTTDPHDQPAPVSDSGGSRPGPFVSVTAGAFHSCALDTSGVVYCWGNNVFGQIGIGTSESPTVPTPIGRATGFSAVDAGGYDSCGIIQGAPFCWGRIAALGDVDGSERSIPTLVQGTPSLRAITVGLSQFCGLSGSTAYCRGVNDWGEVGDGSGSTVFSPVAIEPGGFSIIEGGGSASGETSLAHSCGIAGGVAFCWGANTLGQVGDGTVSGGSSRIRPTRVFGQP